MQSLVIERFVERREAAGLSQSALARLVGIGQSSVNRIEAGETRSPRNLFDLAKALRTTPEYLLGETDDPSPRRGSNELVTPGGLTTAENTVMIPQLEIGYSMGGGTVTADAEPGAMVPFPREWLRPMIGGTFADLFVARGEGDSMIPTLLDGDLVIVDTAQKTIAKQDRLWCLSYGDLGMIKRVRMMPDGGALIISDNPAVENFTAYDEEVRTIGRVIWIGRRV